MARVTATLNVLEIFGGQIRKDTVMRRDVTIITMKTTSVWPDLSTENNELKLYGKHNKKSQQHYATRAGGGGR